MSTTLRIGFIGTGRVAYTLSLALNQAGWPVAAVSNRNFAPASRLATQLPGCVAYPDAQAVADHAQLVFLTVPDDAIQGIVDSLRWRDGVAVVHCSGATELTALQSAADQGAQIGAFHPLQGFGDPKIALHTLPGCAVAIEAPDPLYTRLREIAAALAMRPFALPEGVRTLYHLSGSYAASFIAVLLHEAVQIWQDFGIPRKDALKALSMLAQGSLASIAQQGPTQALTGPISRGDAGTLASHLRALAERKRESLPLYALLAKHSIAMAEQRGLPSEAIERMRRVLEEAVAP